MDKLLNEFTVNRPIEETWTVLTDVERIAPCMPGAQLQEIEGDIYRGLVKVKLGAITTSFKGQASFIERDDADHRAVLKAEGRDTGRQGQRRRPDHRDAGERLARGHQVRRRPPICTSPARSPSSAGGSWPTSARS